MKPGHFHRPCSMCDAPLVHLSSPAALTEKQRTIINPLRPQLEGVAHLRLMWERQRRLFLEKEHSVHSYTPALAGMGGLTTYPYLLYKIIGIDVLHVCSFHL